MHKRKRMEPCGNTFVIFHQPDESEASYGYFHSMRGPCLKPKLGPRLAFKTLTPLLHEKLQVDYTSTW